MSVQTEDRLISDRLDRLEAKLKEDEAQIQEAKRELEFLKNMEVIRRWRRKRNHE